MTNDISLPECARHLARLWPTLPPQQRSHTSKLREQIRSWERDCNRDALLREIPKTIAKLSALNAEERG